ncbi:MAG TPA: OmpA family protein [Cyclobacteriaceae bacterium]|jgi:outer membrane protein OmpA-like peptidoglycan-associated protein|nr:OmpA family protein [Cyclobacteriaceae bacterium]
MKNRMRLGSSALLMVVIISQILSGCNATNTTKGGAIGAGTGAAIGGVIGHQSGNTAVGAIIGAAVGGATGALIGRHMDKQAEELQADLKGAKVTRVGEGILITFDSGLLFPLNSSTLSATTKENLTDLSKTLNKYEDTNVLIEGHTDSSGEDAYNTTLSNKRAAAVEDFLVGEGVKSSRTTTKGYGESQPISSNDTEAGRRDNRRVEVAIYANKEMKKAAEKGDLGAI